MREQLQARLEILRKEDRAGEARLRELEQQLTTLRETVLRISGAIQVLEELLGQDDPAGAANGPTKSAGSTADA